MFRGASRCDKKNKIRTTNVAYFLRHNLFSQKAKKFIRLFDYLSASTESLVVVFLLNLSVELFSRKHSFGFEISYQIIDRFLISLDYITSLPNKQNFSFCGQMT